MKAVGYYQNLPINDADSLVDLTLPDPAPGERDLLVEVHAVSVNPVDVKIRAGVAPEAGHSKVIGWDAAGVVRAVGKDVTLFKPGACAEFCVTVVWVTAEEVAPRTGS
ncbi:alcohol dehydrogenase catalytic domain-containing protein [Xanthomonas citri pv. fuscans]|nr:alcohol dehydrogenase catalytic domain-containing protein [Xanthomonas citri pv. phaseoli var. fuscans]QTL01210.1 alcohol dehydrogenase catalytic domain-containing protein [Xanthomonas citri pv. fuscans]